MGFLNKILSIGLSSFIIMSQSSSSAREVTHEEVLDNMDPNIVAFVDSLMPQFQWEYSKVIARLMGKSGKPQEKIARKVKYLNSQISDLNGWIHELEVLGKIKFDKAVKRRKSDLCGYYKSRMISGVYDCLSRNDFAEENLRAFLTIRYNGREKKFIDEKVQILKSEIDHRFESCINSLKQRRRGVEDQLKLYEPSV
jgi:hypothetical protein